MVSLKKKTKCILSPNSACVSGKLETSLPFSCVLSDGYPSPLLTVYTSLVAERNGTLVPTARQDIAPGQEETEQRQIEQQRQKESKRVAMERLDSPGSLDVSLFSGGASSFLLATASLFQMSEPKAKVTQWGVRNEWKKAFKYLLCLNQWAWSFIYTLYVSLKMPLSLWIQQSHPYVR